MVEWLTRRTSNLRIGTSMGSNPCQTQAIVSLSKKLYTDCSVLVGFRNRFESVYLS